MSDLDDLLKNSDFVTLNIPLMDATYHLINKDRLRQMKKTAYLINNSRGQLVNEEDLYEALVNKEIAGAAQDVFSQEPAGKNKLVMLENFLLTPHIGAFTGESTRNMVLMSVNNLINMLFN
jgi:D-3-phosphoglycerate dehydrogenase